MFTVNKISKDLKFKGFQKILEHYKSFRVLKVSQISRNFKRFHEFEGLFTIFQEIPNDFNGILGIL